MIASIASSFTSVAPALASRATGGRRAARGRNNIVPVFARQTVTEAPKKVKNPPGLADLPATTNVWGLYGAVSPFENGFDPLGLATKVDFGTLKRYREVRAYISHHTGHDLHSSVASSVTLCSSPPPSFQLCRFVIQCC